MVRLMVGYGFFILNMAFRKGRWKLTVIFDSKIE